MRSFLYCSKSFVFFYFSQSHVFFFCRSKLRRVLFLLRLLFFHCCYISLFPARLPPSAGPHLHSSLSPYLIPFHTPLALQTPATSFIFFLFFFFSSSHCPGSSRGVLSCILLSLRAWYYCTVRFSHPLPFQRFPSATCRSTRYRFLCWGVSSSLHATPTLIWRLWLFT